MQPEITYPINLLVIVISTFLCITLGIFLFFNKSVKNNANPFLGGLILVFFIFFFQGFLYRFHLLDNFPYVTSMGIPALFLLGPFAYFYVRSCTQKGYRLRWTNSWHFLPFVINFLLNVPRFLQPSDQRIMEYLAFVNHGKPPNMGDWELLLISLHGLIYFAMSGRLILQYRKNLSNETSAIDTAFHRWMLFFVILLALPVSSIFFYINAEYHRIFIPLQLSSFFLLLLAIYIATLVKPQLFQTFPYQMLIPDSSEEQKQKYERSTLQDNHKEKYMDRIQNYCRIHQPYLQPDLSLAQLAEQVNIPAHHLSQTINEKLDYNFLDFINGYRVEAAKAKLNDSNFSHYTIMAIAYEAGFSAKSTFYSVFKKHVGMTPSAYRKQAISPASESGHLKS